MNPKANNGKGAVDAREWATTNLKEEATFINVIETPNMKEFLLSLDKNDEIIVTGGDGTIHNFINNVYDLNLKNKMYYVKSGSGNDFYRDNAEYADDLGRIELSRFIKNLPLVKVNGIERRFINGIGYGLDGVACAIGEQMRMNTTKPINYTSIAVKQLLGKYKLRHATVTVDGVTNEYDNVWVCPTMKGKHYGGGMKVAPNQDRFDPENKVTVVTFHKKGRIATLLSFTNFSKGNHEKLTKNIASVVGKKIEVKFDKPCALQIDGEVVENVTSYVVEVE
jgi:diacylglycerol kinase family enzyme